MKLPLVAALVFAFLSVNVAVPVEAGAAEILAAPDLAPPRAEARVLGPNPAYLGQMVLIEVELLRDERVAERPAPFFPEIQVSGAIAILVPSAPPPDSRTIDGVSYLVQKRQYQIFPQLTGKLTIPIISVSLPGPDDQHAVLVSTQPLSIQADIPRGAESRLPLVARKVELERKVSRRLDQLRVGDSFEVTVQLAADDTSSVLLPPLELPQVNGLVRYPGQASAMDHSDRGSFHAERSDRATYVARDWGFYELPAVSVLWLDPTTGVYAEAFAPALTFRARVNPSLGGGCVGSSASAAKMGGGLVFLTLLGLFTTRLYRRMRNKQARQSRVQRTSDEGAAFITLRHAARSGQDGATLTALYRWLRFSSQPVPQLDSLRRMASDPNLVRSTVELEDRVCGAGNMGTSSDLIAPLSTYRKSRRDDGEEHRLPGLNST